MERLVTLNGAAEGRRDTAAALVLEGAGRISGRQLRLCAGYGVTPPSTERGALAAVLFPPRLTGLLGPSQGETQNTTGCSLLRCQCSYKKPGTPWCSVLARQALGQRLTNDSDDSRRAGRGLIWCKSGPGASQKPKAKWLGPLEPGRRCQLRPRTGATDGARDATRPIPEDEHGRVRGEEVLVDGVAVSGRPSRASPPGAAELGCFALPSRYQRACQCP